MKAYSLDLRQKIIEAYENEPISQRQIAARFRVAQSVVTRLLKQYRETRQLSPKPRPGRPRALNVEQGQVVKALVGATPDITLGELCHALAEQTGVTVSESTMCREMKRLNLTSKKSPSPQRKS
jgi:transposase